MMDTASCCEGPFPLCPLSHRRAPGRRVFSVAPSDNCYYPYPPTNWNPPNAKKSKYFCRQVPCQVFPDTVRHRAIVPCKHRAKFSWHGICYAQAHTGDAKPVPSFPCNPRAKFSWHGICMGKTRAKFFLQGPCQVFLAYTVP